MFNKGDFSSSARSIECEMARHFSGGTRGSVSAGREERTRKKRRPSRWLPYRVKNHFYGVREGFFTKRRGTIPAGGRRGQESRGKEPLFPNFWVFFRGKVGRLTVFGRLHKNCFWKTNPQKRPFFSFNRMFWVCFWMAWGKDSMPFHFKLLSPSIATIAL